MHELESVTLEKLFIIPADAQSRIKEKTFVGIDFGTSTTVASIASFDAEKECFNCQTLELRQEDIDGTMMTGQLLPSVIAIKPNNSAKVLIGDGAKNLKWNPSYIPNVNLFHSFKLGLGIDKGKIWYESQYDGIKTPQEATKLFFKYLKYVIEEAVKDLGLSSDIEYAVSIPASFESNQRKDLLEALYSNGMMAGKSIFIDEPNAAFLSYIKPDQFRRDPIRFGKNVYPKVLVFDFGAGTCDISILELSVDHNGLHSRNISISQFHELGGNNIDKYIAEKYLYPALLKENRKKENEYRTKQKDCIVDQLRPIAEELKISACKGLIFAYGDESDFNAFVKEGKYVNVVRPISIETDYGTLEQTVFKLSYKDFIELMKQFAHKPSLLAELFSFDKSKCRTNVIDIVSDALDKAKLSKKDVDYVMLVGGSAKNPCVQHALADFFGEEVKMLIPQDLQYLVSRGAALHSLLFNGLGVQAIKPITSESVMVITREGSRVVLPAGTEIPFSPIEFDELTTREMPTKEVELPICVSSPDKMLFNIKMTRDDGGEFSPHSRIVLSLEMGVDKILKVSATCMGHSCCVTAVNPFANSSMTPDEIKIAAAERNAYNAKLNGDDCYVESLKKLAVAYENGDKKLLAAETLEELNEMGGLVSENRIGILYAESGNSEKAQKWYRKAIEKSPNNPWPMSNLALELTQVGDNDEALEWFRRSLENDSANYYTLYNMALVEQEEGYDDEAKKHFKQAFTLLRRKCLDDDMTDTDWTWMESVANNAGKEDEGKELMKRRKLRKKDKGYNDGNLAVSAIKNNKEV